MSLRDRPNWWQPPWLFWWLLERGIRATGYVRPKGGHRRLQEQVQAPAYVVERMREYPLAAG